MKYIGTFNNIKGVGYQIELVVDNGADTVNELILSDNPVTISFDVTDDIFKPCKYKGATIRCVTDRYLSQFVSDKITDVKVDIIELGEEGDNHIIFRGFVTPESFNQQFCNLYDEYELNCIDALSALKYIKYEKLNEGGNVSILELLQESFFRIGRLEQIDVDNNIGLISLHDLEIETKMLEYLFVSESNFFDEDNCAWMWSDVIEEIMKYLCCSCFVEGLRVYVINYRNIKSAKQYSRVLYNRLGSPIVYNHSNYIYEVDHKVDKCSDGNITTNPSYNEIKLVCDNYPIDGSDLNMISKDVHDVTSLSERKLRDGRTLAFIPYLYKVTQPLIELYNDIDDNEYWYFNKFLKPNNMNLYGYNDGATSVDTSKYPTNLLEYARYFGCCLIGNNVVDARKDLTDRQKDFYHWPLINETDDVLYLWSDNAINGNIDYDKNEDGTLKYPRITIVRTYQPGDYITELNYSVSPQLNNKLVFSLIPYMTREDDYHWPSASDVFLEFTSQSTFVATENFFVTFKITGDLFATQQGKYAHINTVDDRDYFSFYNINNVNTMPRAFVYDKLRLPLPENPSLTAVLRIGNSYWNGSTWQESYASFELPLEQDENNFGHFTNLKNSKFTYNIEPNLYCVSCNYSKPLIGQLEFKLLYPQKFINYYYKFAGSSKVIDVNKLIFTDFAINVVNGSTSTNLDKTNTDSTEYTIIIDDDNVNEYTDIEHKICTWDDLAVNYSSVMVGYNYEEVFYLDKVQFDQDNYIRFEEYALQNYYSQLRTPQLIYNVSIVNYIKPSMLVRYSSLHQETNILDYIVSGYEWDLRSMKNNITLHELKDFISADVSKENIQRQYYRTGLIYKANPS